MAEQAGVNVMPLPQLPARLSTGHKGTFGRVLLIGGSVGMAGSISLSGLAALRSGSGLVSVATPKSVQSVVASFNPCYMTIGLDVSETGELAESNSADFLTALRLNEMDAVGIGPGLGQSVAAAALLKLVLGSASCPVVLDADALNIAAQSDLLRHTDRRQPIVITPHPGEFSRLCGQPIPRTPADREQAAIEFAQSCQSSTHPLIVVLKGAGTIVTNGHRMFRNKTGNSGMATGGTGDVLTGIVTSLMGQKMEPLAAAALAVHIHGLAGDLAAAKFSERGMIAADLLDCLPQAWLQLSS